MKVFFPHTETQKVVSALEHALEGRQLGDLVSFRVEGKNLQVVISKLGTSTLSFTQRAKDNGSEFELSGEKIAFTHRAFVDQVKEKFCNVVEKAGGKVVTR